MMHELNLVVRSLRKSLGFATAVVITLALAIGANTVIFSAVEAVLLHPFPVRHLDRLVAIGAYDAGNGAHYGLNPANLFALEKRRDLFDAVAGYASLDVNLTGEGEPRHAAAVATTSEFFKVFDVRPFLGRLYDDRDSQSGATNVVVLSYDYWRALTGGDPTSIGRRLQINDSTFTLLGVLPPGFGYPSGVELWTPRPLMARLDPRASDEVQHLGWLVPTVARLRPDATLPHVEAALAAALHGWFDERPEIYKSSLKFTLQARPVAVAWAGSLRPILFVLVGAVALVLLIACANIASLQLLRATGRSREIAVRLALGATRWDIARLFALESGVLALAGGALGVGLGQWLVSAAGTNAATMVPELDGLRLDPLVLAFSLSATVATAFLFGTAPAVHALRTNARDALNAATRGASSGRARARLLHGAVIVQLAISLILVLSCAVTIRSLVKLLHVDPGFDPHGVVTARVMLPPSRYSVTNIEEARRSLAIHAQIRDRLRAVPGIEAVGFSDVIPFSFRDEMDASIHRLATWRGTRPSAPDATIATDMWFVDADYFTALRIPLLEGPGFTGHEQADLFRDYPARRATPVIIDETARRRLFPGEDPINKMIDSGLQVVGVVGSVRKSNLAAQADDAGAVYLPGGGTLATLTFVVRSSLPFAQTAAGLRDAIHSFDPALPLYDVEPLGEMIERSTGSRRIAVSLIGALAGLSLVLALLGIYSVSSYATSQRTKEIGIRVALGAAPVEVARLIMRGCVALTIGGLLAGLVGYAAIGRGLASLVYGINLDDPLTLVVAIVGLAGAALLASLPTAVRAARIDPVHALRTE